ncbi:hypothetical protein Micbo1qcDRAFT_48406 [Microdochium bolleyi]|uniref:Uncharacterized protein n=1 Tax=Microdochium bolleyi TaxID=196109 RepID=A0A136IL80_9PEZI|nr:hypothetical protein Micbo1qcDRAFT_48406 [Microdochium bolleyi]
MAEVQVLPHGIDVPPEDPGVEIATTEVPDVQVSSNLASGDVDADGDTEDTALDLGFKFILAEDEADGQLSAPMKNTKSQESIPREIIADGTAQGECLRPIYAGTYRGDHAYLVRLQFQISSPRRNEKWLSRIQTMQISIALEDAPVANSNKARDNSDDDDSDSDNSGDENDDQGMPRHASIEKYFPGPGVWKGSATTNEISTTMSGSFQAGYEGITSAGIETSRTRSRVATGAVSVITRRGGRHRNALLVCVDEDPVTPKGVPEHLVIPLLIVRPAHRFSMTVKLHAKYGLWRGPVADKFPIMGKADAPLFFDPGELQRRMEKQARIGGSKGIAEWRGILDDVDLQSLSSLDGYSKA